MSVLAETVIALLAGATVVGALVDRDRRVATYLPNRAWTSDQFRPKGVVNQSGVSESVRNYLSLLWWKRSFNGPANDVTFRHFSGGPRYSERVIDHGDIMAYRGERGEERQMSRQPWLRERAMIMLAQQPRNSSVRQYWEVVAANA